MITTLHQTSPYASRHRRRLRVADVPGTGPEEAPQPVLLPPGDDVDVQVGDALAHDVVLGHEAPRRLHRRPHRALDPLHLPEEGTDAVRREVGEGLDVVTGQDERVAGK